jgi:GTP-binding protein TrmE N-terminus
MIYFFQRSLRTATPIFRHVHTTNLTRVPSQNQTIYALSTPAGKGGIAVVRISGPNIKDVWKQIVLPTSTKLRGTPIVKLKPRYMYRCSVIDGGGTEEVLDNGLVVFFQGTLLLIHRLRLGIMLYISPTFFHNRRRA